MTIDDETFLDIHMHAFNLSHPCFYAFLRRYRLLPDSLLDAGIKYVSIIVSVIVIVVGIIFGTVFGVVSLLWKLPVLASLIVSIIASMIIFVVVLLGIWPRLRPFIRRRINKMRRKFNNMLSVFENDIGSFFLLTENCLREEKNPLLKADVLTIGERGYRKIVITPLMMDFGQKYKKVVDPGIHYKDPAGKPIVEQVVDVFNAIRWYKEANHSDELEKAFPFLRRDTNRLIEIYPFLGINTQNYSLEKIDDILKKYFQNYSGRREDLLENMRKLDGDVRKIKSNFFAGVKVYPPLGFDPWPSVKSEQEKVIKLYDYCVDHGIPITSHGGGGGFVAIDDKDQLMDYTSISKWEAVVDKYPSLKLNIAHFPAEYEDQSKKAKPDYKQEKQRLESIKRIILDSKYGNVYTDFSCRASNKEYYKSLRNVLDSLSNGDKDKLTSHILFGSDFAVNLGDVESYNRYVDIFARTKHLTPREKHAFCCVNPQRFLFSADEQ